MIIFATCDLKLFVYQLPPISVRPTTLKQHLSMPVTFVFVSSPVIPRQLLPLKSVARGPIFLVSALARVQ